ncbi:Flagellar M-ring protein [Alphaproteobacteria bacterium]
MEFLDKLGKFKLVFIITSALIMIALILFLSLGISKPTMVPLYKQLSAEDFRSITLRLQTLNIPFHENQDKDNNQVLVSVDKVSKTRMILAQEGLPSSGSVVGYEIFDKSDILGTSQFINNVNLVRALEGELSRTIGNLAQIETARVHLVLPRKELFSKIGPIPSASVVLKIKPGQKLSKGEINGVAHLLVTAVPELKLENVTILDQNSKPLKVKNDDEEEGTPSNATEYRTNLENRLKNAVEEMIERYVGAGKVKVNVSALIDFDREVVNTEVYNPEEQAIRSRKSSVEEEQEGLQNNNVSVANNVPNLPQQRQQNAPNKNKNKSDEITNYEISKTITNKIIPWGRVKQLSIAVLVDGIYTVDAQNKKLLYKERSVDELEKLRALVSAAIGADQSRGDRVEVINLKFITSDDIDAAEWKNNSILGKFGENFHSFTQLIIVLVVFALAGLLLIRPLISKFLRSAKSAGSILIPELGEAMGIHKNETIDVEDKKHGETQMSGESAAQSTGMEQERVSGKVFGEKRYAELMRYLNEVMQQNPDDAVTVLRNWLYKHEV